MSRSLCASMWIVVVMLIASGCGDDADVTHADGSASIVQTSISIETAAPPANPVSGDSTPATLNRALAQAYQQANVPNDAMKKVLVMVPGFLGGAGDFDYLARRLVARSQGTTVVWAVDRRSNGLEDQTGLDAAEAARDPDIAKNYYFHHAPVGGRTFAGFVKGSDARFESEWGITTQIDDLDALISEAIRRYPHAAIFLGGHSLGGAIVPIYAAWDFGGRAGFERLSGLVLLEGSANPAAGTAIPRQSAYETTGLPSGGVTASVRTVRTNPIVSLPFIGPELFVTAEIIAMRVRMGSASADSPDNDLTSGFLGVLSGLEQPPVMTNRAALGFGFDNDYEPLAFARVSVGNAIGPVGVSPNAAFFHSFLGPDDVLLAPIDPGAHYDWMTSNRVSGGEPTDIDTFAGVLFTGPSNFIEWYFPARLTLDVGITSALDVRPTGDWRKDVYGMAVTENARVDLPVFAVGASRGLATEPSRFFSYRDSIAPRLRNGATRAATAAGFSIMIQPRYVHLDVLTADDSGAGNGEFAALVQWMDEAVRLAPPPSFRPE